MGGRRRRVWLARKRENEKWRMHGDFGDTVRRFKREEAVGDERVRLGKKVQGRFGQTSFL